MEWPSQRDMTSNVMAVRSLTRAGGTGKYIFEHDASQVFFDADSVAASEGSDTPATSTSSTQQ